MILGLNEEELLEFGHNACAGCGEALAARYVMKAAGKNTIVVNATGCLEVFSTPYPQTAWKVPWIHGAFENASAIASGVETALKKLGKKKDVNVLAFGGDGGTFDIGFQSLSGMAERGHNVCYVCYDNEAYMNCLSVDSLVMTEKGLKKITEVKKGEMVYAFNQKNYQLVLKKCMGVFDNGRKRVFELETLHHNIKATGNHPFLVLKHNRRGKENTFVWKNLDKIKKGDEIVTLKKISEGISYIFKKIKLTKKGDYKVNKLNKVKLPLKSSVELMRYFGIYLGDGWIRKERGELGFDVPKKNRARKKLLELQKKIFKLSAKTDDNYVYVNSVNITKFIDSLGFGKGAKNKIIPSWIFTLPEKEKIAFVDGLMLSDGYKHGKSWRYVSASKELLSRLRLLLQTMNFRVGKIHCQVKKKGTHCVYRNLLKDSSYGYICFSKKSKPKISKYISQYKYTNFLIDNLNFDIEKVKNVVKKGVESTFDLRVDGEHNFVADGIVVHNTGVQRSGATPKYASTTTSPAGKKIPGKTEYAKPMPFIMAAHGIYVATASIAYPQDLIRKVKKALSMDGPSYIQIFNSCPLGWKHKFNLGIRIAELAYKTNVFPLYEIEKGIVTISKKPVQKTPVVEYLKLQGRFKHLGEEEVKEIQGNVDAKWEKLLKLEETKIGF